MNKTANDILKINQAFYDAFAAGDYAAVEKLWAKVNEVSVIHPRSGVLHGRKAVMMSWQQILINSGGSQISCADPKAYILGETAYVVCNEVFPEGQLIATNIFVFEDDAWRMVHHQAGPCNQVSQRASDITKSLH
jgi:hypothetical protein